MPPQSGGVVENMLNIGEIIKTLRKEKKMSQDKLCAGICDQKTMSQYENGRKAIPKTVFEKLAERLGISSDIYPAFENANELLANCMTRFCKASKV